MSVRAEPDGQLGLPAAPLALTIDADTAPSPAGAATQVTQRLGRFTILRLLGEGGMGAVYAAYDEQLDRRVAVKLLRQLERESGTHMQRVLREAQAMARVAHENVVHVYEVGQLNSQSNSQIFIAMEFIDGMTLTAWQRQKERTWQELLAVYRQAALGLWAASFCVAFYEALYQRAPFASSDLVDALNPGRPRPPPADSAVPIDVFTALSRGMSTEPEARFPSIAELIEAMAPTRASESNAAKALRRTLTRIGGPLLLICSIVMAVKSVHSALRIEALIGFMAFSFSITASIAFVMRRMFHNNPFIRELVIRYLCFSATLFCLRCLGLLLQLEVKTLIPIDLMVAGGLTTGYAYPLMPIMWVTVACFELAAAASVLWPRYGAFLINLAFGFFSCNLYYAWARTARGKKPA